MAPVPASALSATDRVLARRSEARPRDRVAGIILVLCVLGAVALTGGRIWEIATSTPPPASGSLAPVFRAPLLDGGHFDLEARRGEVLLLDFWATWCPPCVASLPRLEHLHERFSEQGFSVLGVNQEPGEQARVRAFLAGKAVSFPSVVDDGAVGAQYGVTSLPTTYLIDREGTVRAVFRGLVPEAKLERAIEQVLSEG